LILLIASVNVINLLLSRAVAREKEFAVRAALGSGRRLLIRQLLIESCLLSLSGGVLGLAAAYWWVDYLSEMIRNDLPVWITVHVDLKVLAFTFAIATLTGLIAGLFPAWHSFRSNMAQVLKEGKTGSGGRHRKVLYHGLMVTEKVLAVVLLIAAGLMVKSFMKMQQVELGFNPNNLATFRVALGWKAYQGEERRAGYYKQALEKIGALPEVEAVTMTSNPPFGPHEQRSTFTIEGQSIYEHQKNPLINYKRISPNYLQLMEIDILQGRAFTEFDLRKTTPVTIINEKLARKFWPDGSALGNRIKFSEPDSDWPYMTVVGVARDVRHDHLAREPGYDVYYPYFQRPLLSQYLLLKTRTPFSTLRPKLNSIIFGIDPEQCAYDFQTMHDRIDSRVWQKTVTSTLFAAFGLLAALLAAIGIFSVMSYAVSRRIKEMGIRRVFGAGTGDVLKIIMLETLKLTAISATVGIALALFLSDFLSEILYEVSTKDPLIFFTVPVVLTAVAFLAAMTPAIRAASVKPTVALRHE
ncbi:FtsX-like permease family protein, partial [bacterium]|nr:FtsX-like permease family protein [bacterium]